MNERPTYESGTVERDGWPARPQTPEELVAAAMAPENLHALVHAFWDHWQSIREHEESRKEGR